MFPQYNRLFSCNGYVLVPFTDLDWDGIDMKQTEIHLFIWLTYILKGAI